MQQASFYVYCRRLVLKSVLEVGSKHFDQSQYDPHSTKHPRVSIWYQFFLHVLSVQVVLLWECQCNVSTMLPRCGKMVLYRGNKMQKKTRCLFCDLLNCHWQSLGFVSGLLHLSEIHAQLYICTSFEWGRCHFTYTQLIFVETLRWVGDTSNWAGKQKVTWRGSNPAIGDGKLRGGVLFLNLQPSSMGPFSEAKQDHGLWCGILDLQIHDDLMEVFTENPKKEALCGILVADLMYPMTRTGRFLSESLVENLSDLASEECKGHVIQMLPASRLRLNRFTVGDDVEYWSATSKCLGLQNPPSLTDEGLPESWWCWWLGVDELSLNKVSGRP